MTRPTRFVRSLETAPGESSAGNDADTTASSSPADEDTLNNLVPVRLPKDNNKTVLQIADLINGTGGLVPVCGTKTALATLFDVVLKGARTQKEVSEGPYAAYEPLSTSLCNIATDAEKGLLQPKSLYKLHQGNVFHNYARAFALVARLENGLGLHERMNAGQLSKFVDKSKITIESARALLCTLSTFMKEQGGEQTHLQLGILFYDPSLACYHAVTFPTYHGQPNNLGSWVEAQPTITIWLAHKLEERDGQIVHCWYGLSKPTNPLQESVSSSPECDDDSDADYTDSEPDTPAPGRTHRTRVQSVQHAVMHNELPLATAPDRIFNNHPEALYYGNLVRVALHYGNSDIRDRVSRYLVSCSEDPITSPSTMTKRITFAVEDLADRFEVPRPVMRAVFNMLRIGNGIQAKGWRVIKKDDRRRYGAKVREAFASLGVDVQI